MVTATGLGLSNSQKHALFVEAAKSLSGEELQSAIATAAVVPIAKQMIENAKMRMILPIDRFDSGPALTYVMKKRAKAVKIPRYGDMPTYLTTYERFQVEPWLIEISPSISTIDIMDANFNVVADILDTAGKELAVAEDEEGFRLFDAAADLPGSAWPSSGDEWPTISAGPGGIGKVLSTNVARLDDGTVPVAQDIIKAKSYLEEIGFAGNLLVMTPYTAGLLMATDEFLKYINFGKNDVMERGYVETALGIRFVTSPLCQSGTIYIADVEEFARFVERNAVTMETKTERLRANWLLWERIAVFARNANAVVRIGYQE